MGMDKYFDRAVLDLYSDYLLSSFGLTTATGLSELLGGAVSHDRISRFLNSEPLTSSTLWRLVKPLVRQVQSEDAVLVMDDSILAKPYTDESELICWHWAHAHDQTISS